MTETRGPVCHTLFGRGFGNSESNVVFIGIAPGKQEERIGKPFVGPSGKLLDACLKALEMKREDYYCTNLVCWVDDSPDVREMDLCERRLYEEIKEINPRVIVALGAKPIARLSGNNAKQGIVSWNSLYECWVINTYHPAAILRAQSESLARDFLADLSKINVYLEMDEMARDVEYKVVWNVNEVNEWLDKRNKEDFLVLDVETRISNGQLRCIGLAQGEDCIVVPDVEGSWIDWNKHLDKRWTFQNGMFDVRVIWEKFGIELPIVEDTMYMHYCLDERAGEGDEGYDIGVGIHGLKKLAGGWLGAGSYDISVEESSDSDLWDYNAKDAVYTGRLARLFEEKMREDGVEGVYRELLIGAANKAWRSKRRGMFIDAEKLRVLGWAWLKEWHEKREWLEEMAWARGWPQDKEFNPGSPTQLRRLLYDIMDLKVSGVWGKNTQAKTIAEMREEWNDEFVDLLLEWRGLDKDIGTYVKNLMESVDGEGYIHPDPVLHATVTGRLAYKNPPMQTIPRRVNQKRSLMRSVFTVESEERELLEADYMQSEIYWAAAVSGDEQMKEDLESGDFHGAATKQLWPEIAEETIEFRRKRDESKFVTFGIAFGRQAPALHKAELRHYSLEECREFVNAWLRRYWKYARWRRNQRELIMREGEQVSRSGRKRRYPIVFDSKSFNQSMNYPIQSISHDNLMASYIELFDELVERWDAWIVVEVHDSLLIDMPKKWRKEVVEKVRNVMEKNRYGISVPVEFKVGSDWLNMRRIDG